MKHAASLFLLLSPAALAGCSRAPEPTASPSPAAPPAATSSPSPPDDPRVARAQEAVGMLKSRLLAELQAGLLQGPEQAIAACREMAPRIAAEASAGGIAVGRTSGKLRNPANAPQPWMVPLLATYEGPNAPTTGTATALPDGSLGWVEPLRIAPTCLTCHGDVPPGPLKDRLTELYPEDRATGYREGEVRGLAWAIVPPAPQGT